MDNLAAVLPPSSADFDQLLGDEITLLAGQINAANYRLLKLIAAFDDRKAWLGGGTIRSCAFWLNWKCGLAIGAAREQVRVAHCLKTLPLIDASFASGEISFSKVRAMTRVATPENEDYLLMIARFGTASHVEKVVRKYRSVNCANDDKSDIKQQQRQQEERKLVYYQDEDGSWVIHARLPAEEGSLVVKAIEAVATPERQELQAQLEQKKVVENVSAETFLVETPPELEVPAEPRKTYRQARADALVKMAEHFLSTCDQGGQSQALKGAERCQIMLHVNIDTLRRHGIENRSGHVCCNLDDKHWISPKTAKRLSCDASLVTVLENKQGKVLNIGRRARTVPPSIKRALELRDKTCRVPGCCQSRHLDAHHIQHWADGGETSIDNLVHLCRFHHTQLHQGLFTIHVKEFQIVFSTPSGQRIEASIFPQFSDQSVRGAKEALQEAAPAVNARTCITRWAGESCDYGMAMDGLLQRDGRSGSAEC
jgi:hypothetical protein